MPPASDTNTLAKWTLTEVTEANPVAVEIDRIISCGPHRLRCKVVIDEEDKEGSKGWIVKTSGYKLTHWVKGSSVNVAFYVATKDELTKMIEELLIKDFPKILTKQKKVFQLFPPQKKPLAPEVTTDKKDEKDGEQRQG